MQVVQLNIPIVEVQLDNDPVSVICFPLVDKEVAQTGAAAWRIAQDFNQAFQKNIMDKGYYQRLLDYQMPDDFELKEIELHFNNESFKKKIDFRPFSIRLQYLLRKEEAGYWCLLPTLGIETFTEHEDQIEESVRTVILLDFARNKRFDFVQSVISTIWYEKFELNYHINNLQSYTLTELERLNEQKKKQILENAAKALSIETQQLFGYKKYLKQFGEALKNRYNRNVLLVGKSGVGKSALVYEWVYQNRKKTEFPKVWTTTAATLIKELTNDMGWQENLSMLCKELMEKGDILYVRNLLEMFEVGQYEGNSVSMAEYLKDYIARGEISLVTECSDEEFALIEARSPNYLNFFQVLRIEEPLGQEMEDIVLQKVLAISGLKPGTIEAEAIRETIRLNKRYTPYSGFPGKPIRFLESLLVNSEAQLKVAGELTTIDRAAVIKAFCEETGMPIFMVDPDVPMDVPSLRNFFLSNVFGQDHAIFILSDVLVSVKAALMRPGKPIASMLFAGPTGVGKTEMAKVLAEFMFGSRERMIRFDMSEYATPYAVARLTGESYFSDGILTSAVRREPFCVLLFDELEKAHPLFNDLLLQILGEGRLTDSQGKVVNFCSTIIIMTTNIGASKLQTRKVGWSDAVSNQEVSEHFENEVRKYFRPEIFNRIDQIVAFHPLSKLVMHKVVEREIQQLKKREGINHRKIDIFFSPELLDYLCELGYDARYGARALQRALREELIIPLAYELNHYGPDDRLQIKIDVADGQVQLLVQADPLQFEFLMEELQQSQYMDYASELRYQIAKLREGHFYVHLLSDLDMLKRDIKQMKSKFWENQQKSSAYSNLLAMQQRVEEHKNTIEGLEMELALSSLGLQTINSKLYEEIKAWDKAFFSLKLDLYRLLDPDADKISIGIYLHKHKGDFNRLLELYRYVCNEKEFDLSIQSVWYRESLYLETKDIEVDEFEYPQYSDAKVLETIEKEGEATIFKLRVPQKEYYKKIYDPSQHAKSIRPDKSEDKLVGIELIIKGPGANLFFAHENKMHAVEYEQNKEELFYLETADGLISTPKDVFRWDLKTMYRKPRRKYSMRAVTDLELVFPKYEVIPGERAAIMLKVWQKLFEAHLNELVR